MNCCCRCFYYYYYYYDNRSSWVFVQSRLISQDGRESIVRDIKIDSRPASMTPELQPLVANKVDVCAIIYTFLLGTLEELY